MRNWNKFKLVGDGDFLRKYAREHGLFIYPYDLLTGADIALFEDFETKKNDEHFLVCTMNDDVTDFLWIFFKRGIQIKSIGFT